LPAAAVPVVPAPPVVLAAPAAPVAAVVAQHAAFRVHRVRQEPRESLDHRENQERLVRLDSLEPAHPVEWLKWLSAHRARLVRPDLRDPPVQMEMPVLQAHRALPPQQQLAHQVPVVLLEQREPQVNQAPQVTMASLRQVSQPCPVTPDPRVMQARLALPDSLDAMAVAVEWDHLGLRDPQVHLARQVPLATQALPDRTESQEIPVSLASVRSTAPSTAAFSSRTVRFVAPALESTAATIEICLVVPKLSTIHQINISPIFDDAIQIHF